MRLGFGEILVILVIALLVFGPSKLPQLGDALGKGIRNFKKSAAEGDADDSIDVTPKDQQPAQSQLSQGAATTPPTTAASAEKKV